jgi:hypothetical protein
VLLLKKKIDPLYNLPDDDKETALKKVRDEISDAYSNELISELNYSLLKEKISNYEKHKT